MSSSKIGQSRIPRLKFAIIGYGVFSKLLCELLIPHASVKIISRRTLKSSDLPAGVKQAKVSSISDCDVVILANELARLKADCEAIKPYVKPSMIVMDVCSVKTLPVQIMKQVLNGRCQLLATHPLFGPQSVTGNDATGKIMVWHEVTPGDFMALRTLFTDKIKLLIENFTPEEHDCEMAWVHTLTFFVGRGVLSLKPPHSKLATNYYKQLHRLIDIEKNHSWELFLTIQMGNPYASDMRRKLLTSLLDLDSKLKGLNND